MLERSSASGLRRDEQRYRQLRLVLLRLAKQIDQRGRDRPRAALVGTHARQQRVEATSPIRAQPAPQRLRGDLTPRLQELLVVSLHCREPS